MAKRYIKNCEECNKEFIASKINMRFCCRKCSQASGRRRRKYFGNLDKEEEIKISDYYLKRGDILKNIATGRTHFGVV
jgi:hypothetical protein